MFQNDYERMKSKIMIMLKKNFHSQKNSNGTNNRQNRISPLMISYYFLNVLHLLTHVLEIMVKGYVEIRKFIMRAVMNPYIRH